MKKLLLLLLIMCFTVSFVFAENDTVKNTEENGDNEVEVEHGEVGEATEVELKVFEDHWGARMRMLQLERALMKNILIGDEVVGVINTNHPDNSTTLLTNILADMESQLDEVRGLDFEGTAEELAGEYAEIKELSVNLTREFKLEGDKYLTGEDRAAVRAAIKNKGEGLKGIGAEINAAKRQLNAQRMLRFLDKLGIKDKGLAERIQAGELTKQQVMAEIKGMAREMKGTAAKAQNAIAQAAHKKAQVVESATRGLAAKLKGRHETMVANRLLRGAHQLEVASNRTAQRVRVLDEDKFEKRAERLKNISTRLDTQSEKLQQRAQKMGGKR